MNAPRAVCVLQHVRETDGGSSTPCVGVHAKRASLNIQFDLSHSVSSCFCLKNRSLGGANTCRARSFVGCKGTTSGHMTVCYFIIVSSIVKTHKSEGLYASRPRHDWDKCFPREKITKNLFQKVCHFYPNATTNKNVLHLQRSLKLSPREKDKICTKIWHVCSCLQT